LEAFLRQPPDVVVPVGQSWQGLAELLGQQMAVTGPIVSARRSGGN
jgi:hypothetical protein